jgi:hypothetical protein
LESWIRIRIKKKGRIRIRIKVKSQTQIRTQIKSQEAWGSAVKDLYASVADSDHFDEDTDPHQSEKSDPDKMKSRINTRVQRLPNYADVKTFEKNAKKLLIKKLQEI